MMMWLGNILFLSGLLVFISMRKYLLNMLLSLEFMMLSLFMMLMISLVLNESDMYLLMLFLVFVVCEGALGLAILVSMIRGYGNSNFQSFSILMC